MISVGQYLCNRLQELGLNHIFGVPGDYVLSLMDVFVESPIDLICTCNELNAGYAADAYARIKGLGAVCITYGVGGFSLVNAVVGAYAERVPLVVISGGPNNAVRGNHLLLHHTTGDYNLQFSIMEKATVAAVIITEPGQAAKQIDQVLAACLHYKRPVYIEIPSDLVNQPCPPSVDISLPIKELTDINALNEAVEEAVTLLEKAKKPVILSGVEIHRFQMQSKLIKLLDKTGYPIATTLLGKSCIPELHPQFIGNYVGALSRESIRQRIETSDCILCLGAIMSDMNLGIYTAQLDAQKLINANSEKVKIKNHFYQPIYLGDFIDGLMNNLTSRNYESLDIKPASYLLTKNFEVKPDKKIISQKFYERINHFLDDDFIVISDTGDAIIATIDLLMHKGAEFIGQAFYLSIGYSIPACLGAALASPKHRPIVFVGDGAFQMTAQELSTIIRHKLNPIIFLLNNDGYTIERLIHDGPYNDIQPWKYHELPHIFGESWSCEVSTEGELEEALIKAKSNTDCVSFIEIHLDRFDCSPGLIRLGKEVNKMEMNELEKK
ncbi:alpha-keto acid decarboxylase family protein [Aphanothece sacrum]|uniref:Alpha-keto-acid decarboxylase n=1 Tax=Aphanothece sacrum FPU1 TaxID=1920663 RepID=A0A401IC37_APHSA|nr:thiamine pyrophosphate-binding protein [Aphanothece sacrum]GBF78790.1 thiamine pyrophosphate protein [Aphanothece sacrum FPU1]GBF83022.1 thiamine pyrophosphate protein [Aphanothece sacrum FPU3]